MPYPVNYIIEQLNTVLPIMVALAAIIALINRRFREKLESLFLVSKPATSDKANLDKLDERLKAIEESLSKLTQTPLDPAAAWPFPTNMTADDEDDEGNSDQEHEQINDRVEAAADQYFKSLSHSEKLKEFAKDKKAYATARLSRGFDRTIESQLSSANNIRAVMLNLFVFFNFALLLLFTLSSDKFSDRVSASIFGIYISLSAFIIYIYRASNSRVATILSVKEDERKMINVFDYLEHHRKSTTFSSNELELIKFLSTNRFEREKGAEHPYEIILKGITNSTVLLKGGKITTPHEKAK